MNEGYDVLDTEVFRKQHALNCLEDAFNQTDKAFKYKFVFGFNLDQSKVAVVHGHNKYFVNVNGDSVLSMIYDVITHLYKAV